MIVGGGKKLTFATNYSKVLFTHGISFDEKLINVMNTR